MASIEKRNKTYRIKVSSGSDGNGKRIVETLNYVPVATTPKKIEKEVQKVAMEFEERVKNGLYLSGDKVTFEQYLSTWREQWAVDSLTQHGLESYEDIIQNRAIKEIGNMPIGKIRPTHIQSIVTTMKNEGKSSATIRRVLTAINSVMRYAYDMEVIEVNPCDRVRVPKQEKNETLHYFTPEQVNAFLDALERSYPCVRRGHNSTNRKTGEKFSVKEYTQYTEIPFQWRVFFNLAIYGGFRRGELCALTWNDINFEDNTITIRKAFSKIKGGQELRSPKTESGFRTVTLPSGSFSLLHEWYTMEKELSFKLGTLWSGHRGKNFNQNYVFIQLDCGEPMSVDTPTHKFREIIDMYNRTCENEDDKLPLIRLHDLRHSSATLLISNGVDISTVSHRLGHKHTSVTLDVYSHFLPDKDSQASDTLERLLQKQA